MESGIFSAKDFVMPTYMYLVTYRVPYLMYSLSMMIKSEAHIISNPWLWRRFRATVGT